MASDVKKCAHELCSCIPPDHEKYCSTFCKDSASTTTLRCDCGHPGCESPAAIGARPLI